MPVLHQGYLGSRYLGKSDKPPYLTKRKDKQLRPIASLFHHIFLNSFNCNFRRIWNPMCPNCRPTKALLSGKEISGDIFQQQTDARRLSKDDPNPTTAVHHIEAGKQPIIGCYFLASQDLVMWGRSHICSDLLSLLSCPYFLSTILKNILKPVQNFYLVPKKFFPAF